MPVVRTLLLSVFVIAAASCLDVASPTDQSQIRFINASTTAIDVSVDGAPLLQAVAAPNVSAVFVPPGTHTMNFTATGGLAVAQTVTTTVGNVTTVYAVWPSANSFGVTVLDTGGVVAAGRTKLRVSHLSKTAGQIEIFRTQPDFPTPTLIQTPFPYLATSPFLESSAGKWEVFVTRPGSSVKLLSTGAIDIPSGGKRTVVLLDSAGVMVVRVMPE